MKLKTLDKKKLLKKHPWTKMLIWKYIETGYREPNNSFEQSLMTLFTPHNELINTWSHILGCIIIIFLFIKSSTTLTNFNDLLVFGTYLISAFIVCLCSSVYHLFCCHSKYVCEHTQCIDWMAISLLIFSSNFISSYYEIQDTEIFCLFTSLNLFLMTITSSGILYKYKECNHVDPVNPVDSYYVKTYMYILYGLGTIIACIIGSILSNKISPTLPGILTMYGFYALVILCVIHFPEKYLPAGTVDIYGSSHQIFHFGVIFGIITHWYTYYQNKI